MFKVQRRKRILQRSSEEHEEEKIKIRKIQILLSTDFTDYHRLRNRGTFFVDERC